MRRRLEITLATLSWLVGAADELDGRGLQRAAQRIAHAALGGDARGDGRAHRRQPRVGRDRPGDLVQRMAPVEAAGGQAADGLAALVAQGGEGRVRLQGLRLVGGRLRLCLDVGELLATVGDRAVGERVRGAERRPPSRGRRGGCRSRGRRRPPPLRERPRSSAGMRLTALMPGASSTARPAATVRVRRPAPAGAPSTTPSSTGRPSSEARASAKPGITVAGPVSTARETLPASSCMRWKSSELRTSAAMRRTPSSRMLARLGDDLGVALDRLDGRLDADVREPAVGVRRASARCARPARRRGPRRRRRRRG